MATTVSTLVRQSMPRGEITALDQLVAPRFCWHNLNESQRQQCIANDTSHRIQFKTLRGIKYGWDVRGVVQTFWNETLCQRFQQYFHDYRAYILEDSDWDELTKCLMIGFTKEKSTPTVLIMCNDKGIAKRFARTIKRDDRFRTSGFDLLASIARLEFRAGDEGKTTPPTIGNIPFVEQRERDAGLKFTKPGSKYFAQNYHQHPDYDRASHPQTASLDTIQSGGVGSAITAQFKNLSSRQATLGGYIKVGESQFGLTVAHLFDDRASTHWRAETAVDPGKDQYTDLYDLLEELSDEKDEPAGWLKNIEKLQSPSSQPRSYTHGITEIRLTASNKLVGLTHSDPRRKHLSQNGLDWALVNPTRPLEGYVNRYESRDGAFKFIISRVLANPPSKKVLVCSEDDQSPTNISRTKTLIHLPNSISLEAAYAIEGINKDGECGSWVVECESGEAFGTLVAVSPTEGLSYTVPLQDVLERISHAWEESVDLPQLSEETLVAPYLNVMSMKLPENLDMPSSPSEKPGLYELAQAHYEEGRFVDAINLLEQVFGRRGNQSDSVDEEFLSAQWTLGKAYFANGQISDAIKILEKVVRTQEEMLNVDDAKRLRAEYLLARAYLQNRQTSDAIEGLKKVVSFHEKNINENNSDRLEAQFRLGLAYYDNKQIYDAIRILEKVGSLWEKSLAEDDPYRIAAQQVLGKAYLESAEIQREIDGIENPV